MATLNGRESLRNGLPEVESSSVNTHANAMQFVTIGVRLHPLCVHSNYILIAHMYLAQTHNNETQILTFNSECATGTGTDVESQIQVSPRSRHPRPYSSSNSAPLEFEKAEEGL